MARESLIRLWEVLHQACFGRDQAVPPPTMSDEARLSAWMAEMRGLEETPGGALKPRDVIAVVAWMRNENRMGRASWAVRPSRILSQPEAFRDLVLQSRRPLRQRGEPAMRDVVRGDGMHVRDVAPEPDAVWAGEAGAEALRALRERLGGKGK